MSLAQTEVKDVECIREAKEVDLYLHAQTEVKDVECIREAKEVDLYLHALPTLEQGLNQSSRNKKSPPQQLLQTTKLCP